MAQQQSDLAVGQREDLLGQVLLMRALPGDSKLLEPFADTERRPAVAVAADDELMPGTGVFVASDAAAEHLRGAAHRGTVLLRARRVTQWLVHWVAAITDEMSEQDEPVVWPTSRLGRFGEAPRKRESVALP